MSGGVQKAVKLISEPRGINVAQIILYAVAALCGLAAAVGALEPVFMTSSVGPPLIIAVGSILTAGGITGSFAVIAGMWWLERIALIVTGLGWFLLLPAALFFAATSEKSAIWLVVGLVVVVLCDAYKRYRRIDWAYLDPTR